MAYRKSVLKLRTKITLLVCLVVALALLTANFMVGEKVEQNTERSLAEKATDISRIVARSAVVIEGLAGLRPASEIQPFAEEIRRVTSVEFIVVFDMNGIRKSHPDVTKIGLPFVGGDEGAVLKGEEYVSEAVGTLGPSLRSFSPVFDSTGRQIGAVSVGILLDKVQQAVDQSQSGIYLAVFVGLLVGVVGAIFLAGNIKKAMFGLEPAAFAQLLQERVAMLQSVREGIIAVDKDARITLVNGEGLRVLVRAGISGDPVGEDVESVIPNTRLKDVLRTGAAELDQEQDLNGLVLLTNRVPVFVDGEIAGAIATFRDKTEIRQMAEQLSGVRNYAEALRSQAHEFMNKLHVILGMIRMECFDQLTGYVNGIAHKYQEEVGFVARRVKDPVLAGFLLGKLSRAREAGVELVLTEDCHVPMTNDAGTVHDLVTIVGNLVDNALEAVENSPIKQVTVCLDYHAGSFSLLVSDTGPGIPADKRSEIFANGFSTKGDGRGMGLFLVQRCLNKLNGTIKIKDAPGGGAHFRVIVPYRYKDGIDD